MRDIQTECVKIWLKINKFDSIVHVSKKEYIFKSDFVIIYLKSEYLLKDRQCLSSLIYLKFCDIKN